MFEGFIVGMLLWAGPAAVAWIFAGPGRLIDRFKGHP
jgi:hypothetical protein